MQGWLVLSDHFKQGMKSTASDAFRHQQQLEL